MIPQKSSQRDLNWTFVTYEDWSSGRLWFQKPNATFPKYAFLESDWFQGCQIRMELLVERFVCWLAANYKNNIYEENIYMFETYAGFDWLVSSPWQPWLALKEEFKLLVVVDSESIRCSLSQQKAAQQSCFKNMAAEFLIFTISASHIWQSSCFFKV